MSYLSCNNRTDRAVTRIKDTTARRDAERLGKAERTRLPRVTAYTTANSYNMDGLMKFLKARTTTRGTAPKKFDECIFTPFSYTYKQVQLHRADDLLSLHEQDVIKNIPPITKGVQYENDFDDRSLLRFVDQQSHAVRSSDVFLFQYGVVVIWGMRVEEEGRFLRDIAKFETEKLADDDVQVENFNFYVTSSYQPRIYNDFITLKDGRNYMIKLSISHAIAQSVKVNALLIPGSFATTAHVDRSHCLKTSLIIPLKIQSQYHRISPRPER